MRQPSAYGGHPEPYAPVWRRAVADADALTDGDTLYVGADLGVYVYAWLQLRVAGVNAPEMTTMAGKYARSRLWVLLREYPQVRIFTGKPSAAGVQPMTFGRYPADVEFCVNPTAAPELRKWYDLGEWLLANGLAAPSAKRVTARRTPLDIPPSLITLPPA